MTAKPLKIKRQGKKKAQPHSKTKKSKKLYDTEYDSPQ